MTVAEMAKAAGCSVETIRRWARQNRFQHRKHGISGAVTAERSVFSRFCEENDVPFSIEDGAAE